MPEVKGKKFPYTKKGKKEAKKYAAKEMAMGNKKMMMKPKEMYKMMASK